MTKDKALLMALEAMESVTVECNNFHHPKKDQNHHWAKCPPIVRWDKAITAIKEALAQPEPMRLRRGDILRSIETDELCTVWSTSTTGKTLIKWGANDFCGYTAEQIGELFWLEPSPDDLELSAEKSDNYTTSPQRTWVGLTDEDRKQISKEANYHWEMTAGEYAERIGELTEAKLKEKNT